MKMRVASWALVLLAAGVVNASALDRRVQINNVSSYTIMEFYASNTGTSDWQEDILGNDVLAPGSSVMVNIDDSSGYCKYDFLAVFEDGDQAVSADNNVCELTSFDFTD
jgi:FlaG/FlaF family flagellin (archaellin)